MAEPDPALLSDTRHALAEQWNMPTVRLAHVHTRDELLEALKERVLYLLRHDMDKLMAALYILDVGEELFKQSMEQRSADEAALALAKVILDRELEKAELRRRYSRDVSPGDQALPE